MTSPAGARLTALLGSALPIVQAPMAGVQASALAIAVCEAGGLGSLPGAMLGADALRAELQALRAGTRAPFNLNFFAHAPQPADPVAAERWRVVLQPFFDELGLDAAAIPAGPARQPFTDAVADLIEPFAPPVVSFHFGLPPPELVARVKRWGAKVLSSATTVAEARWLAQHGVDAVIAQGLEAGGHRGIFLGDDLTTQLGTFALLPQVVRALGRDGVPVIAAGGIADADGVAAAFALGASGVQVGTSYLLCPEATTSALHRSALAAHAAAGGASRHTALTNCFTGRPARGLVNRLMRECGPIGADVPAFPHAANAVGMLRAAAEKLGRTDFTPLWAGQNASGVRALPAGEITRMLARGLPPG